jgi:hypothetical protein
MMFVCVSYVCFLIQLDLDPKDRHQIKAVMDTLHAPGGGNADDEDDDGGILHDSDIDGSMCDEDEDGFSKHDEEEDDEGEGVEAEVDNDDEDVMLLPDGDVNQ